MTDTIMLEAPARGWRISDLADGQGRILRLHDLTASSLGHTSHANPDRKPINVANQTESPTRTGGRVTIERKPDEGDGPAVIHRLNDERDQRWQNLIAGFLVHASRGVVRHDGQHEYTAVLCGPQAAMPFDLGTDTHTRHSGDTAIPWTMAVLTARNSSPWIYGPDTSDIHPRPSAKEGRTNMKMRTDVLWEPDKTDEHDRLLSRFEDDIIGLRARTVSPCEMAIHS